MDRPVTYLPDFRISSPLPDASNLTDFRTLYDSVAYGSEPSYYVKQGNSFLWGAQLPCSNFYTNGLYDTLEEESKNYHDLTSYQVHGNVPQSDLCAKTAQEAISSHTSEYYLLPTVTEPNKLSLEHVEGFPRMEEHSISLPIIQEIPKDVVVATSDHVGGGPTKKPPELAGNLLQKEQSSTPGEEPKKTSTTPKPAVNPMPYIPAKGRPYGTVTGDVDRAHACSFCERSFSGTQGLTQHIKSQHSGPKTERCSICGRCFHLRQKLKKHLLQHQEEYKKFPCEHCPSKYSHKHDLKRHQKHVHSGTPNRCQFCDKTFLRIEHKWRHEQTRCKKRNSEA